MKVLDIAWAAGLLEGEGCFSWHRGYPQVSLEMTDRDVIDRFAALFPTKNRRKVMKRKNKDYSVAERPRLDSYRYEMQGTRAVGLMMTVWVLMGQRRQQRISEILLEWRVKPYHESPGSSYYDALYKGTGRRPKK